MYNNSTKNQSALFPNPHSVVLISLTTIISNMCDIPMSMRVAQKLNHDISADTSAMHSAINYHQMVAGETSSNQMAQIILKIFFSVLQLNFLTMKCTWEFFPLSGGENPFSFRDRANNFCIADCGGGCNSRNVMCGTKNLQRKLLIEKKETENMKN